MVQNQELREDKIDNTMPDHTVKSPLPIVYDEEIDSACSCCLIVLMVILALMIVVLFIISHIF